MIDASAKIRIVIVLCILFEHTIRPCDHDLNMTPNDLDIIIRTKCVFLRCRDNWSAKPRPCIYSIISNSSSPHSSIVTLTYIARFIDYITFLQCTFFFKFEICRNVFALKQSWALHPYLLFYIWYYDSALTYFCIGIVFHRCLDKTTNLKALSLLPDIDCS